MAPQVLYSEYTKFLLRNITDGLKAAGRSLKS
jgi:hypothetical protein